MKKNLKLKTSFPMLFIGLSIGIIVGRSIPDALAYDEKAIDNSFFSQEIPLPGQPISSFIIHRPGYSFGYDARNRNPSWVYEHLTAESIKGETKRSLGFK